MYKIISKNRPFFIGFCLWLIFGALIELLFTQNELTIWVNHHHNSVLDVIFKYGTNLGDGLFYAFCIILLFLLGKKQVGFIAAIAFVLVTGIFAYLLKEYVRTPRPITVFAHQMQGIHLVQGVKIAEYFSFPSGHTLSAFSIFMLFSLISRNKYWGIFYLLLSIFVAYSRIYLFQHFAIDVYAGSIFGVAFTLLIVYFFEKRTTITNLD